MHATHSTAAPNPTSATPNGGVSTLQQHPSHAASSSTSSFSSASVVTAKRTSSRSAGARNSIASIQAQSPNDASLIALRVGRENVPQDHRRRRSVAVDPSERASMDGMENFNRWSRSTASSAASGANTRRSRASSGALLPSLLEKGFSSSKGRDGAEPPPPSSIPRPKSSGHSTSPRSPASSRSTRPAWQGSQGDTASTKTTLPNLHTIPGLTDPNDADSPSTLATIATPSTTQSSFRQEYFHAGSTSPLANPTGKQSFTADTANGNASATSTSRIQNVGNGQEHVSQSSTGERRTFSPTYSQAPSGSMQYQPEEPRDIPGSGPGQRRSAVRSRSEKAKKELLSKALSKANTAVVLDNSQNYHSALDAYRDACDLLQQVMDRSAGYEDKRKLDSIRVTYVNRIEELRQMEILTPQPQGEKSLPEPPLSAGSSLVGPQSPQMPTSPRLPVKGESQAAPVAINESPLVDPSIASAISTGNDFNIPAEHADYTLPVERDPLGSQATIVLPVTQPSQQTFTATEQPAPLAQAETRGRDTSAMSVAPLKPLHLATPQDNKYMPRPLSPRRPSASDTRGNEAGQVQSQTLQVATDPPKGVSHIRDGSGVSMSWLDTIDEAGRSSRSSSIHSRSSQYGLHRRPILNTTVDTDPDFDAAFDAAVEAAYDEGFEPDMDGRGDTEAVSHRHAPQQSIVVRSSQIQELWSPTGSSPSMQQTPLDAEEEEEERILDEITQDFAQTFNFDFSSKSALPRQSDSSGYSRSTWQSSMASDRATANTSLSTVAEDTLPPRFAPTAVTAPVPIAIPASEAPASLAPPLPQVSTPRSTGFGQTQNSTVRSRRLSGQNTKQLKIETAAAEAFHFTGPSFREDDELNEITPGKDIFPDDGLLPTLERTISDHEHDRILKSPPSLSLLTTISDDSRPTTARTTATTTTETQGSFDDMDGDELLTTHQPSFFRKNQPSLSLREHTVLLSPTMDHMPPVVPTPMSSTFLQYGLRRPEGPLTSQRAKFPSLASAISDGSQASSVHLFDTSLSASSPLPSSPRSPPGSTPLPVGLEPCPEPLLLRPFWLMRAILSTITHPKGGFISTRVFVPREAWETQGVKLKSVEDKVANCDLLTASLGRLAGVDTYDADAVMEELQSFEEVMERVQIALTKKLGGDVGVHGLSTMFKDAVPSAPAPGSGASSVPYAGGVTPSSAAGTGEKTKSKESKSGYLNSWRKLRSKNSGAPLTGSQNQAGKVADKESTTMASVPMTSFIPVDRRGQRKDSRILIFEGPQKEYMGSLARLFEGAQVLDLIARQVDDPGLKGTSPTHVGLELSIRHAAEFFGFYICRFVLADVGVLLDKYLKRGSEWVLA